VSLGEELDAIAAAAERFAVPGEELRGVLPTEPSPGERIYLCSFLNGSPTGRSWLALDGSAQPVTERARVREAVSIAALCELAEESAGGGDLAELRARLVTLRLTEHPEGIEEAEEAALELERVVATPPRLATPAYLDAVGAATRRLEQALGERGASPFAEAMKQAIPAVESLTAEVEGRYKEQLG
jgi:hypothetical protein